MTLDRAGHAASAAGRRRGAAPPCNRARRRQGTGGEAGGVMAIRRSIAELFEAIPERIEGSGQAPTWEVTGGSFESAATYAEQAFDEAVVIERRDRSRWWRRVTLTVTNDPE